MEELVEVLRNTISGHFERPYLIGISGSVAVGKSTFAKSLKIRLSEIFPERKVEIVGTDNFLFCNEILEEKGIGLKKGFPESYDSEAFSHFLLRLKNGKFPLVCSVYCHERYDILPDRQLMLKKPDIVILEGVYLFQNAYFLSMADYTVFLDASLDILFTWFWLRFESYRKKASKEPDSFFYAFAQMTEDEARAFAFTVWKDINEKNFFENILPYRQYAQVVMTKGPHHHIINKQWSEINR